MSLRIEGLEKKYPSFNLSLSLEVRDGELISVIGPSGSGKSTLLSLISGIEKADSGKIELNGVRIENLEVQKREVGMVFQDYALFQNMNVIKNVMYGMKEKSKKEREKRAKELLKMVELSGYEKRKVSTLSGGEAQRVALVRSIASKPKLLLLDEPLSALDAPMRKYLRGMIRSLQRKLGISMIYVTHDREEAMAISDRILILKDGKEEDLGTGEELYKNPKTLFSAFFTGDGTALPANLFFENSEGSVFFRPEDVVLSEEILSAQSDPDHIILNRAEIISAEFTGPDYVLGLKWEGYPILVKSRFKPRKREASLTILRESICLL